MQVFGAAVPERWADRCLHGRGVKRAKVWGVGVGVGGGAGGEEGGTRGGTELSAVDGSNPGGFGAFPARLRSVHQTHGERRVLGAWVCQ